MSLPKSDLVKSEINSFSNQTVVPSGNLVGEYVFGAEFKAVLCNPSSVLNNYSLYCDFSDNGYDLLKSVEITDDNHTRIIAPFVKIRFVNDDINPDTVSLITYLSSNEISPIDEQLNTIIAGVNLLHTDLTTGGGGPASSVSIVSSITLQTHDADALDQLGDIKGELITLNQEIANPTSVQPITGTIYGILQDEANNKVSTTQNGAKIGIDANIINTSIPVSGTINANIYGSHDGTTFHHILTTPTGKILVNSSTQDGNGTNITSTTLGTSQCLDVAVQNTSIAIKNETGGAITTKSQPANSQQVGASLSFTKPYDTTNPSSFYNAQIGSSVSTTGFLNGAGLVQITSVSGSNPYIYPNIYLQASPDNTNWFDLSSNSFNTTGFYNIQAYNAILYPYLRLYVKFDSVMNTDNITFSCNAWIVQK